MAEATEVVLLLERFPIYADNLLPFDQLEPMQDPLHPSIAQLHSPTLTNKPHLGHELANLAYLDLVALERDIVDIDQVFLSCVAYRGLHTVFVPAPSNA